MKIDSDITAETVETPSVEHDGGLEVDATEMAESATDPAEDATKEADPVRALLIEALSAYVDPNEDGALASDMADTVLNTIEDSPFAIVDTSQAIEVEGVEEERDPYDYDAANLGTEGYAVSRLRSQIRDSMVTRFRHQPKTWQQMSEDEQMDAANAFDMAAGEVIRAMVETMLDFDAPQASIKLGKIDFEGGDKSKITGKFTADYDRDTLITLFESQGRDVTVVMMESADFNLNGFSFRPMPNQPSLPLDPPKQSKADIEADVAAMGEPADVTTPAIKQDGLSAPSEGEESTTPGTPCEEEIGKLTRRAARLVAKGEKLTSGSYIAKRLGISEDVGEMVMNRLKGAGLIGVVETPAPPESNEAVAEEAAAFGTQADDAFEATEAELAAQTPRQALSTAAE